MMGLNLCRETQGIQPPYLLKTLFVGFKHDPNGLFCSDSEGKCKARLTVLSTYKTAHPMNIVLDYSSNSWDVPFCSAVTATSQANLSAVICAVATAAFYVLGPSSNLPLKWIRHWSCVMEGITKTVRGAGHSEQTVPLLTPLLSPPPPLKDSLLINVPHCALAHHCVPPVDYRLDKTLMPVTPPPNFHPCLHHSWVRPLVTISSNSAVQLYHLLSVAWYRKGWKCFCCCCCFYCCCCFVA